MNLWDYIHEHMLGRVPPGTPNQFWEFEQINSLSSLESRGVHLKGCNPLGLWNILVSTPNTPTATCHTPMIFSQARRRYFPVAPHPWREPPKRGSQSFRDCQRLPFLDTWKKTVNPGFTGLVSPTHPFPSYPVPSTLLLVFGHQLSINFEGAVIVGPDGSLEPLEMAI